MLRKRIISVLICFVTLFSMIIPVSAAGLDVAGYVAIAQDLPDIVTGLFKGGYTAGVFAKSFFDESYCPFSSDYRHNIVKQYTVGDSHTSGELGWYYVCEHCGRFASDILSEEYDTYVSGLDTTTAICDISITGYSAVSMGASNTGDIGQCGLNTLLRYYPSQMTSVIHSLGINQNVLITGIAYKSPYRLCGCFFDSSGLLTWGWFDNPVGKFNASLFGVYSLSDLSLVVSYSYDISSGYAMYYSKSFAEQVPSFLYSTCYVINWDMGFSSNSSVSCFVKSSSDVSWMANPAYKSISVSSSWVGSDVVFSPDYSGVLFGSGRNLVQPAGVDSTSRAASLMQTINNYNIDNSITDNSTNINYYIGTVDASNNITNVYSPNLFDEDTLVFVEPSSGVQYTCVGWKYYYDQWAYVLELAENSMSYDGTDIKYLVLMYGDDNVTVTGYSSETTPDNLDFVFSDSYAYVVVSGSECSLYGHTYTYEDVSAPTCTTPGERKYTCSVCGNEYAEEIPKTDHVYEYSVFQEPTCLETGIGLYTCSVCGGQYTELLPAAGHSMEMVEYLPTEYDEDGLITKVGYTRYRCAVCGTEEVVNDDVGIDTESFWERIKDAFTNSLASLIEKVLDFITDVLGKVLDLAYDLLSFFFDFLSGTVISGIGDFFFSFSDSSLFEFFQHTETQTVTQIDEYGNEVQVEVEVTVTALPEGVAAVFAFFSGVIMALPWEFRSLLIFGVAVLVLLSVFKMARS